MLLKAVKNASTVPDTHCRSAAGVDQMLPEYRLHRMTHWVQKEFFFLTVRRGEWICNSTHS